MDGLRRIVAVATTLLLAVTFSASTAAAANAPIVRVEGTTLYIALPEGSVVKGGTKLEVLRTVKVKRPDTGEELTDYFPIGTLTLDAVGTVLSYGHVDKKVARLVTVGDVVRIPDEEPVVRPVPAPTVPPAPVVPIPEAVTASTSESEVLMVFFLTLGKPPAERARILEEYLRSHPDSPYAARLSKEVFSFTALDEKLRRTASAPRVDRPPARAAPKIKWEIPTETRSEVPFEVAAWMTTPDRVTAGTVYYRRVGDTAYKKVLLEKSGDDYLRARVPAEWVVPPAVELFVELIDPAGVPHLIKGAPDEPVVVTVAAPVTGGLKGRHGRSGVRTFFEFVDWNRFRGNDWHIVAESDFLYRVLKGPLYGFRVGFGVWYGKGGRVADLDGPNDDENNAGRNVGFNYAYTEAELRFGKFFGLAGRLTLGQTVLGDGLGGELRFRIGRETATNLVIGGALNPPATDIDGTTGVVGALALLELSWNAVKKFPMSATVIVTNQPAAAEIGVRLVYQISWAGVKWFQPSLRLGYAGRSITHYGFSAGLGLVMSF